MADAVRVDGKDFKVTKVDDLTVQVVTPEIYAPFLEAFEGMEVGTGRAPFDHVVVDEGQPPPAIGATFTEPGALDDVAQLMRAEVWVRSVT